MPPGQWIRSEARLPRSPYPKPTTTNTYDQVGNLETVTDRRGGVTTYTYDELDRVTQVRGEGDFVQTTDYDANGNVVEVTQYDVLGLATVPNEGRSPVYALYQVHLPLVMRPEG